VAGNYSSITTRSFGPLSTLDGKEPLPNAVTQVPSGYVREKPLHIPNEADVSKTHLNSAMLEPNRRRWKL